MSETSSTQSSEDSLNPNKSTDVPSAAEVDCLDDGNSGTPNGNGIDILLNLFDANLDVDKDNSAAKTLLSSRSFATAKDSISSEISTDDDSTIVTCDSNKLHLDGHSPMLMNSFVRQQTTHNHNQHFQSQKG